MFPIKRTAVVIPNYNMPERTDALVEYLADNCRAPYDVYVVDNGSDLVEPSKYTNVWIEENCQTTCGWNTGLMYASEFALRNLPEPYFAYWIMITSTEFVKQDRDPLLGMVRYLMENEDAAVIHPALSDDSTSALMEQMGIKGIYDVRRTYLIDNIAALWRADYLNSIGRFRPELTMGWGVLPEVCWKARRDRKTIWIDERVRVKKVSNIGYDMNRMNMTAKERATKASAEARAVLEPIYGPDYNEKLNHEWVRHDGREWVCDY